MTAKNLAAAALVGVWMMLATGCGGSSSSSRPPQASSQTVGGTVSGLSGTVVLQNNGADNLTLASNGSFTFSTPVAQGGTYNATVLTQPATQTCVVTNGSGTMGDAGITNISLTCSNNSTTLAISASTASCSRDSPTNVLIDVAPVRPQPRAGRRG